MGGGGVAENGCYLRWWVCARGVVRWADACHYLQSKVKRSFLEFESASIHVAGNCSLWNFWAGDTLKCSPFPMTHHDDTLARTWTASLRVEAQPGSYPCWYGSRLVQGAACRRSRSHRSLSSYTTSSFFTSHHRFFLLALSSRRRRRSQPQHCTDART
eukprot:COSAG06_NODE_1376_length_9648_cov_67.818096_4_plen_158_part_00